MGASGPRRIGAFLTGGLSRAVAAYLDEATRLRAAWQAHVPEPLASHTEPVRLSGGVLVVHADTPVWASRLRQQQPTLVSRLAREPLLARLSGIRIKVMPRSEAEPRPASRPASRPPLSPETSRLLQSVANGILHPGLRAALLRLARCSTSHPPAGER